MVLQYIYGWVMYQLFRMGGRGGKYAGFIINYWPCTVGVVDIRPGAGIYYRTSSLDNSGRCSGAARLVADKSSYQAYLTKEQAPRGLLFL